MTLDTRYMSFVLNVVNAVCPNKPALLSVIMLNVILLNVVLLNVVAPLLHLAKQ
jgi:hypothetical protein